MVHRSTYPLPANQRALLLWLTRAQKQSSFCLLQNRRPESQSPTFRRPADRGYNTLDFASKVRVPKRGVAPFGFSHHFRFSDTKPTLPVLHPCPGNLKKHRRHLQRGCWPCFFIFIQKFFLQYYVSVGCGVVSLTKGTSGFPTGHGLAGHTKHLGKLLLSNFTFLPELLYCLSDF